MFGPSTGCMTKSLTKIIQNTSTHIEMYTHYVLYGRCVMAPRMGTQTNERTFTLPRYKFRMHFSTVHVHVG